jgi:hypothetical protein
MSWATEISNVIGASPISAAFRGALAHHGDRPCTRASGADEPMPMGVPPPVPCRRCGDVQPTIVCPSPRVEIAKPALAGIGYVAAIDCVTQIVKSAPQIVDDGPETAETAKGATA